MPLTFTPADIVYPAHRPGCDPEQDCDCPGARQQLRCSADNSVVHVNPTTMQTAYCDGQPMHRWLYTAAGFDNMSRAGFGYGWRQVP